MSVLKDVKAQAPTSFDFAVLALLKRTYSHELNPAQALTELQTITENFPE